MNKTMQVIITGTATGLNNALRSARTGVKDFNKDVAKSASKRQGINDLGTTYGKIGLVAAAGAAMAVRSYANFDKAMSHVKATGQDAVKNQEELRQAALDAGQATQFNATQSANAIEELVKAGVDAKDVLGGGLKGSLDLAAAGSLEVADAASIAATTLVQFKLKGKDVPHVADLLAAAAGKAQGDVTDMGQALKYVGPVAAQMGVSLEETTGTIALLASNGILADQAGTGMRGMLMAMTSPSKIAAKTMKELGINVYDAQGNFVGFEGVAGQLKDTMGDLSNSERDAAFGRMFGNEQITAARVLYDGGASAVKNWTKQVDDSGYAAETASTKMDNLSGDWEQFTGALETGLIGTGEGANSPLRGVLQDATDIVNVYNKMPAPIKAGTMQMLGLTAIVGLGGFAASRAVTGYSKMTTSVEQSGRAAQGAGGKYLAMRGGAAAAGLALIAFSDQIGESNEALGTVSEVLGGAALGFAAAGPWGAAVGAGVTVIKKFGEAHQVAKKKVQDLSSTLDNETGAITENTKAMAANALQKAGANKLAAKVGVDPALMVEAATGNANAAAAIQKQLNAALKKNSGHGLVDQATGLKTDSAADDAAQARIMALADMLNVETEALDRATAGWEKRDAAKKEAARAALGALAPVTDDLAAKTGDVAKYGDAFKKIPAKVQTDVIENGADASKASVDALCKIYDLTPKEVRTILEAQDKASDAIGDVATDMETLDGKSANPTADLHNRATGPIKNTIGWMYTLDRTNANPRVNVLGADNAIRKVGSLKSALQSFANNYNATTTVGVLAPPKKKANGGIVDYFANGGLVSGSNSYRTRENHIAEIAPAGTNRLWAEPETGGESYIPLAVSKRTQSRKIWAETGKRLGVPGYADGAVLGGGGGTGQLRLADNRIRLEDDGVFRLIDTRIEQVTAGQARHLAAKSRRQPSK